MARPLEPNRRRSLSDPLAAALMPPPNESAADRERRLEAESEAKRVSDGIDEMLRAEKKEKKAKPEIKVLILGQSESGKSTTLKQFQLMHAKAAFHADRIAWRAVIYLNLVRSVRRILDAVSPESDQPDEAEDQETASGLTISLTNPSSVTKVARYPQYRHALEPLRELEERLIRMLSSPNEDEPTHTTPSKPDWSIYANGNSNTQVTVGKNGRPAPFITIPPLQTSSPLSPSTSLPSPGGSSNSSSKSKNVEVSVHHTSNWKKAFSLGNRIKSPKSAHTNEIEGWWDDPSDPVHVLNSCAQPMLALWKDPSVKQRLREKRIRVEEGSGFFLDEISRITALRYFPSDQDVLKARLKTTGVVEHSFSIADSQRRFITWKIYDVGGARNQRHAWAPYFEDVNAIIFLAPISAFDQVLAEAPEVNRLEDSLLLWRSVVSNKLLAHVSIILFLNKVDLLQAKLKSGVRLSHHMPRYGDRPNDYENVSSYFYNKFGSIHQAFTSNKEREFKIHLTSVTDTRRTATIIQNVRDIIITVNLKNIHLM
ncbi:guanine nucleotide binding protein, alpha subunit [Suillus subalutaceus]|uniref:guanine nucleotide binding protein, alpha subunit n=1 Tax=Suillus subalutaceus TaxID=48586 RepID=UPI001B864E4F|nr:guanine nucleotide binding protein, alpha subunit [Suillus subalutaceus]KAG1848508.1 guanine nucleotide binding protein, alpha subunit [Suillus subalutaceus]